MTLTVVETIPAGAFPERTLGPGECARVFTGAPIPAGADCVIRQEHTTALESQAVRVDDLSDLHRNVRRRGEDIERGTVVLEAGTELRPAQIGVLASLAYGEVETHRVPRVAVLASGDELVDLDRSDAIRSGRKIASSNTYTMMAMTRAAGAEPMNLGIAPDEREALTQHLTRAKAADALVTSGAMSVGEHDHLRSILEEAGTAMKFWRLKTRPGAPVGFGILNGTPWIGLPGNPVSTMVSFELFVRPAIRKMMGYRKLFRRTRDVIVGERISTPPRLTHFLRVRITEEDGVLVARLTGSQSSGVLSSMVHADGLLIVPEEVDELPVGAGARVIMLDEARHVSDMPY